jgi:hypothetical protein
MNNIFKVLLLLFFFYCFGADPASSSGSSPFLIKSVYMNVMDAKTEIK